MVNYKNAKIYKIVCNVTRLVYVGATCEKYLSNRLAGHCSQYKCYLSKTNKNYITSFKVLENNDFYIELLEKANCSDKDELKKIEGQWIRKCNCVNKRVEDRTKQEYKKIYKQLNKEQIKEQDKEYYLKNKELIREKQSTKYTCICGNILSINSKSRHEKRKKHQKYLQTLNQ